VYTGKGSEIKEAMTSKYFNQVWRKHDDIGAWVDEQTKEAYEKGKELYWKDDYLTIVVEGKNVSVEYNTSYVNENISKLVAFRMVAHRFACFDYAFDLTFPENFSGVYCPNISSEEVIRDFAEKELKLEPRIATIYALDTFSLPYLLANNKAGDLVNITHETSPQRELLIKKARENPYNIFTYPSVNVSVRFKVNFSESINCIKFPISSYANLTLNITMPSKIINYTLGRFPQIIIENYTIENSLVARIRVYPFNGIKNMEEQMGEVCS
jgi:hypothetical protein